MSRSGTLVDVHRAITKKVKEDTNKTTRLAAVHLWGVFRICFCNCVNMDAREKMYQDMSDEALAAMRFTAKALATGRNDVQRLLADVVANPAGAGLRYGTGEDGDVTLTTRTSITFLAE
eukprot:jgi/Undpi1/4162/HiC_scaffold_16.g07529.m1